MLLQSEWYNQNTPADDSFLGSWKYEKMPIFIFLDYGSHHASLSFTMPILPSLEAGQRISEILRRSHFPRLGHSFNQFFCIFTATDLNGGWFCPSPSHRRPHAPLISITYNHRLTLAHSTAGAWENMKYWHRTRLLDQKTIDSDPSGKTCSGKNLIEILCG